MTTEPLTPNRLLDLYEKIISQPRPKDRVYVSASRNVPVEAVQQMFMDTGLSRNEAAKALGWTRRQERTQRWRREDGTWGEGTYIQEERGDVTRLGRTLGWSPRWNKEGEPEWSRTVHYNTAVTLCRAWGLDPVDYGI